jgi:hypothetical protein
LSIEIRIALEFVVESKNAARHPPGLEIRDAGLDPKHPFKRALDVLAAVKTKSNMS